MSHSCGRLGPITLGTLRETGGWQTMAPGRLPVFVDKAVLEQATLVCLCIVWSRVVVTEAIRSTNLKYLVSGPLRKSLPNAALEHASDLSCQEARKLGYLFTDSLLSAAISCSWVCHLPQKSPSGIETSVLRGGSCQLAWELCTKVAGRLRVGRGDVGVASRAPTLVLTTIIVD